MLGFSLDIMTLLYATTVFGLVLSVWALVLLLWLIHRRSRAVKREIRLGLLEEDAGRPRVLRLWRDGTEATTVVADTKVARSWGERLRSLPRQAGWEVPIQSLVLGLVGAALLVFIVTLAVSGSFLAAAAGPVAVVLVFWVYLKHRISRWVARFERQFAEALELIARSLRAGHPLLGAFRFVAEQMRPPASTLFADICQQQALGASLEESLQTVARTSTSEDLRLFATSVSIQLRSGGNLADMMDRLASVIRQRMKMSRRVRIITAQTQFSKRILFVLPVAVLVGLSLLKPQYMEPLYSTRVGLILIGSAVMSLLFGGWLMNRMAVVRY